MNKKIICISLASMFIIMGLTTASALEINITNNKPNFKNTLQPLDDEIWDTISVDTESSSKLGVGLGTSIALDSKGHPHISYIVNTRDGYYWGNLKYAQWTGAEWDIQTIDTDVSPHVSQICIDSNDNPHIAYMGIPPNHNYKLKYATFKGAEWELETIYDDGCIGLSNLILDKNDKPHICFNERFVSNGWSVYSVNYAYKENSQWVLELIEEPECGPCCVALDSNGIPHIFYEKDIYDNSGSFVVGGELKHAKKTNSGWKKQILESTIREFKEEILAEIDSKNHAHIIYNDLHGVKSATLSYIDLNLASNSMNKLIVDDVGLDWYLDLILDSNEKPHISYNNLHGGEVKYGFLDGSNWRIELVKTEKEDRYGRWTSITLDSNNNPYISYYGTKTHGLILAEKLRDEQPPTIPTITGETKIAPEVKYEYIISSEDPENQQVYFHIDWGDKKQKDWFGPYPSGEEITVSHTWAEKGTYDIRIKSRDIYGVESYYGTLKVSMSKAKLFTKINFLLNRLLLNFEGLFPILKHFLNL